MDFHTSLFLSQEQIAELRKEEREARKDAIHKAVAEANKEQSVYLEEQRQVFI